MSMELVPDTGEEMPSQQIARRIRGLLAENQISGTKMAQAIGLDQRAFSRRYSGKVEWSIDELSQLAVALRLPFAELTRHATIGNAESRPEEDRLSDVYGIRDSNPEPAD